MLTREATIPSALAHAPCEATVPRPLAHAAGKAAVPGALAHAASESTVPCPLIYSTILAVVVGQVRIIFLLTENKTKVEDDCVHHSSFATFILNN